MQNIMLKAVPFIFCTGIIFSLIVGGAEYDKKEPEKAVKQEVKVNKLKQERETTTNQAETTTKIKHKTKKHITKDVKVQTLELESETEATTELPEANYDSSVLTRSGGVNYNSQGMKETYYNLDMSGVISIMRGEGFSESKYPFWIRDDGAKMLGDYIMVAADLSKHPRGTTIHTSLGTGLVCDTGSFIYSNSNQIDIATNW